MIPEELKYTETHEWIKVDGNIITLGITHYAQEQLTDIVFVELPDEGRDVDKGSECAVIESCKIAAEMYAPAAGKITAINEDLNENPALVNQDPYGSGWIVKLEISDSSQLDELMDAAGYKNHIEQSG